MKAVVIGVSALVVVALAVGGYFAFRPDSNDSTSGQTDYAAQLDSLCLDSRKKTEALGKPSDIPISTFYPGTVRIGRAFLKDAKELTPPPDQTAAAKTFLQQRGLYYDGLEYGYQFLTSQSNAVAFQRIVEGAIANLVKAETAAKALGAAECALRPFE